MGGDAFAPPFYQCNACEVGPCYCWWGFCAHKAMACLRGDQTNPDWRAVPTYSIRIEREYFVVGKGGREGTARPPRKIEKKDPTGLGALFG